MKWVNKETKKDKPQLMMNLKVKRLHQKSDFRMISAIRFQGGPCQ